MRTARIVVVLIALFAAPAWASEAQIAPGWLAIRMVDQSPNAASQSNEAATAPENGARIWLRPEVVVDSTMITDVEHGVDAIGSPAVVVRLSRLGARRLAKATADNVGGSMAVIVGDKVLFAPRIITPVSGRFMFLPVPGGKVELINRPNAMPDLVANPTADREAKAKDFAALIRSAARK